MTKELNALRLLNDHFEGMQRLLASYLQHDIDKDKFLGEIIDCLDGSEQREIQAKVNEALR